MPYDECIWVVGLSHVHFTWPVTSLFNLFWKGHNQHALLGLIAVNWLICSHTGLESNHLAGESFSARSDVSWPLSVFAFGRETMKCYTSHPRIFFIVPVLPCVRGTPRDFAVINWHDGICLYILVASQSLLQCPHVKWMGRKWRSHTVTPTLVLASAF